MKEENVSLKPLLYSCSGCSSAAQMANFIALKLDRSGIAEMSCIAGVGGNVKKLVRLAKSGRKLITIDGCPLACSKACLQNHQLTPDVPIELTTFGVVKTQGQDFNIEHAQVIQNRIEQILHRSFPASKGDINCNTKNTTTPKEEVVLHK